MTVVPLDRRFIVWTDKEVSDPELMSYLVASREALSWKDLLVKHRVVILAEAGSGKSIELSEQARLSSATGSYTFSATLQNVGRRGLEGALGKLASLKLVEWRSSEQPAWFFLDSVDEAKSNDVRLDDALKEIAYGIAGGESRAHIVLSGRHTDWEFRRDLEHLKTWIEMPPPDLETPAVDPNELIVGVIRLDNAQNPPQPAEAPLVVVMAALDRRRVEAFANGKGVANIDAFFNSLDRFNLWAFARRPLDLGWLVEFWSTHGTFGPLEKILDLSLQQRLLEPDLQRARKDPIDSDRANKALERIGAALVLQDLRDIAVPDSGLDLGAGRPALELAEILPDWSGEHRARLISRAAFDPASAGLARLHNDNQGAVRSFLAARWLKRLMEANSSMSVVMDLLFATTYGVPLVIPSMRQTAAWLSLWSSHIAHEIVERDPRLLMDAGDPGSLKLAVRDQALKAVLRQVVDDDEFDIPDRDSLKRFALPDMVPSIRDLWLEHGGSAAAREVLLLMISLGELDSCADLAVSASFGRHSDRYTQVFSGRALMAVASNMEKRRYAEYVRDHAGTILSVLVWDAVDTLFPTVLSIDDLLAVIKSVDLTDSSDGLGIGYVGPKLAERLDSATQTERLLAGMLDGLADPVSPIAGSVYEENPILSTIEAVGRRLLELSASTEAPGAAIEAILRLGEWQHTRRQSSTDAETDLFSLLHATPERRRAALWRAAERFAGAEPLRGTPITSDWQIEVLGYSPGLRAEDYEWLLRDAEHRSASNERQLAVNAALRLWRQGGEPEGEFARIEVIGTIHPDVAAVIENWIRPPSQLKVEYGQLAKTMRQMQRHSDVETAKRDQSWRDFANGLRADPDQLRAIKPPAEQCIDGRLYNLWQLLDAVGKNRSRYAIDDLSMLVPMLGPAVVAALRDAFVSYWRHWSPQLRSERAANMRNTIYTIDCIGIVGVTLEAAKNPTWASELSYDNAVRAAIYATLELNGFPSWFANLAQVQPDATRDVLARSIAPELSATEVGVRCDELEKISQADMAISSLVSDQLFDFLYSKESLPSVVLRPMLRIIRSGYKDTDKLVSLLNMRFNRATAVEEESTYFAPLFELDPAQAIGTLDAKLAVLSSDNQTVLVQALLSMLFGARWGDGGVRLSNIPFLSLESLILIAYRVIRVENDNKHPSGRAYSPDMRDDAEMARGMLLKTLIDTPGRATFDAIHRLIENPEFTVGRRRMLAIARERAGNDSEREAWTSADVFAFESDSLMVPRNPFDLQRLVLRKLKDLQHDLLNSDYAQGTTVSRLPHEVDVQKWMADRLRMEQGRSYSIEREPHVVEEKEPDIRFRAKASDANVPMEIKVAESWPLKELEDALRLQLIGRYLRDRHNRYGILMLVHQKPRLKGWQATDGDWLSFEQVVSHLRHLAWLIAAESPNSPQVEIAIIDVSSA